MRKTILLTLMAATAIPGIASAQTTELRHDRRDVREERHDVRDAQRHGDRQDVRDERRDVRDARREYREDWRGYRDSNREVFRQRSYVGPRGYAYRPVVTGYRFQPTYYNRRYWIADPYRYRLARPGINQQWVRYGNDVVLVNVRTGRVVTVYNRFFW